MDIAVISDQHLGYGWDTRRQDDSFAAFREALEEAADADLILLPGDLFDRKVPRQEVLGRVIELFRMFEDEDTNFHIREESDKIPEFRGKPIIAIHGTHERRSTDSLNPIQLLEKAGYLCHLHNESVILEDGEETVAVHGMSGVPERYAPEVLQRFDPEAVEDAYNILLLHQSIENFVYTDADQPALKLEHLPDDFDCIIDGHIHWKNLDLWGKDRPLIIPGSTITTQMNQIEADEPKGFLMIDTREGTDGLEFIELDEPRDVIHRELDVTGRTGSEARKAFDATMDEIIEDRKKAPLVRINLTGRTDAAISLTELRQGWDDDAVLHIGKQVTTEQEKAEDDIEYEEKDAREMGMEMLQHQIGWDRLDDLFALLADGDIDAALEALEDLDLREVREMSEDRTATVPGDDVTAEPGTDEDENDTDDGAETGTGKQQEKEGLGAYLQ